MVDEQNRLKKLLDEANAAGASKSVSNFNRLTREHLLQVHRLQSRLAKAQYLRFLVEELDGCDDFADELCRNPDLNVEDWGKRDVICYPSSEPASWHQKEAPELLKPLQSIAGERWWCIALTKEQWDWSGVAGAPGVVIKAASYWYSAGDGVEFAEIGDSPVLEVSDNIEAHLGIWLASRLAWSLRMKPASVLESTEAVCEALDIDIQAIGQTTRQAIDYLIASNWRPGMPGVFGKAPASDRKS